MNFGGFFKLTADDTDRPRLDWELNQLLAELAEIEAESIGWIPLGEQAYAHRGEEGPADEILVVGIPDATMAGLNVLLVS